MIFTESRPEFIYMSRAEYMALSESRKLYGIIRMALETLEVGGPAVVLSCSKRCNGRRCSVRVQAYKHAKTMWGVRSISAAHIKPNGSGVNSLAIIRR